MKMINIFIILSSVGVAVFGQVPSLGFCPQYIPMSDFQMDKFLGKWYEVERFFTVSEVASRCVVMEFTRSPNGRIYVENEITNRLTGVKRVVEGTLELSGATGEGKMSIKYNSFPRYDVSYTVLETDYENMAILWSCSGIGPVHTQNAWVLTRDRQPADSVMQRVFGILDKYKISRTLFLKTDQKDCLRNGVPDESFSSTSPPVDQEEEHE